MIKIKNDSNMNTNDGTILSANLIINNNIMIYVTYKNIKNTIKENMQTLH